MTSLHNSLVDDLPTPSKLALIVAIWKVDRTQAQRYLKTSFAAYWGYYQEACMHALNEGGRYNVARTHQDIVDLTDHMNTDEPRNNLQTVLRSRLTKTHHNEAEMIDAAIDLAASLLLMVDFRSAQHGYSGSQHIEWSQGSLRDCVAGYFKPVTNLGHDGVKLPRGFNARNLNLIAGLEIVPTANLLDHLRLIDDDTKVFIFHHATFLKLQPHSPLLPQDLIDETLRTLALLFPDPDPALRRWVRRLPVFSMMDPQVMFCGHLKTDDRQIEKFVHWHDRMVVLKQVFDEATPRTLSQWWYDRRNGVQWYTFWVAILVLAMTLVFGFIQSIASIMQVYAAFNLRA